MALTRVALNTTSLQLAASPLVSSQSRQSPAGTALFPFAPSRASLRQPHAARPSTAPHCSSFFGSSLPHRPTVHAPPRKAHRRVSAEAAGSASPDGASPDGGESAPEVGHTLAPLRPSSPTGEFLVKMLEDYPHLFPSAADQQLERLASEKQEADSKANATGSELVLYE